MKSIHKSFMILVFMFLGIGCSKDDAWVNNELLGVWFDKVDYADQDQTRITEWSFISDGTIEIVYLEYEKSSGNFLGYSVLYKGKYTVNNDILYIENMFGYSYSFDGENYLADATYLASKEALYSRKGGGPWSNSASINFGKRKQELNLTYLECNDILNANCVGSKSLTRK